MEDLQISYSVESEGKTFVAVISWDFDNWCSDGFYAVEGTNLSEGQILDLIYGDVSQLEEWEENTHKLPTQYARECTDLEIDTHFNPYILK